tara:strand:- start:342 stop:548 length:207 start_codon:yes stop_codon:yes gene_type:complete
MSRNEEHNQEQYEAYMNQDIDSDKPLLKNCDCYMCEEETRVLIGDFLKYDMGMNESEIESQMKKMSIK